MTDFGVADGGNGWTVLWERRGATIALAFIGPPGPSPLFVVSLPA